jgi:hypothetical protein
VPQQPQVDHLDQGLPVSQWVVPSHVRTSWPRIGTATPARVAIDAATLRFGESAPDTTMQQPPTVAVEMVETLAARPSPHAERGISM